MSNLNAFILIITIGYSLYGYVYDGNITSNIEIPETTKKDNTDEQSENNEIMDLKNNLHDVDNSPLIWVESRKPPLRVIQSNYGKILNLMIPSNN